jgi:hypothetical protein
MFLLKRLLDGKRGLDKSVPGALDKGEGTMRYVKTLGPLFIAAIALTALVGATTASATVLCKNNLNTEKCSERYPVGTEFKTHLTGTAVMTTSFKNISCAEASGEGKLESEGSSTETPWGKGTGTYGNCNCEVKVLATGTLEVHHIAGTDNGTVTFKNTAVTASCATIFGSVHCIYTTEATDLGTLTSGSPANADFEGANIPRLATNGLCAEKANLDATFEITTPNPLYVAAS